MNSSVEPLSFLFDPPVSRKEGDYEIDGILHCGKCHGPKQKYVQLLGEQKLVPVLCPCGVEQQKAYEKQKEEEKRRRRIENNKQEAFLRSNYKLFTFSSADDRHSKELQQAKNYVEHYEELEKKGRGIIYFGSVGTGKTFLSCCIANALLDIGKRVLVRNFSDIANEHFDAYDKEYVFEKYSRCSLLVIDDFAIERKTEYMSEIVYQIIDGRIGNCKPMIITTNLSPQNMKEATELREKRLFSRINEVCFPINITGFDGRLKKAKESYVEDLKLLNGGL